MLQNIKKGIYFDTEIGGGSSTAESEKPETNEPMIPKTRFDEVIKKQHEAEAELARIKAERQAEAEKRLVEQEEWKQIAEERGTKLEEAQRKAQKADSYEARAEARYEQVLKDLPDEVKNLIPEKYSTVDKLDWIDTNRAILTKPQAVQTGAGIRGAGGSSAPDFELTEAEKAMAKKFGMTEEEYAKNK